VLTIDRFGNIQLAATEADLEASGLSNEAVTVDAVGRAHAVVRGATFGAARRGRPVLLVDSAGHIAIAVRDGNAASSFGVRPGDQIVVHR
jgi:S-adenosylmethionine hydrolase